MNMTPHDPADTPAAQTSTVELAPSAALDQLAFFVGDWHGYGTFFPVLGFAPKPIEMTIDVARAVNGRWYVFRTAEHATAANGDPLQAMYVWGYDEAAHHFVAAWFDSNGGRAAQTSPGWTNDTLVFTGEITTGGRTVPLRDTFVKQGPRAYHHRGEVQVEGRWITVDEEDLTRST